MLGNKYIKTLTEHISTAIMSGMGPVILPGNGTLGSGDAPAGSGDAEKEYKKKKKQVNKMKHLKTLESHIIEGINLKQSNLSSEEYEKAKKLKGFDEVDWEWNGDKQLYSKVKESIVTEGSVVDNQISKVYNSSEGIKSTIRGLSRLLKEPLDQGALDYVDMIKDNLEDTLKMLKKIK
jgi:hypothetical protein